MLALFAIPSLSFSQSDESNVVNYTETTVLLQTANGSIDSEGETQYVKNPDKRYEKVNWSITLNKLDKTGLVERNRDIFKVTGYGVTYHTDEATGYETPVLYMECYKISTKETCTIVMISDGDKGIYVGLYTKNPLRAKYYTNR